jgi:hypothetical protein
MKYDMARVSTIIILRIGGSPFLQPVLLENESKDPVRK